MRRLAFALVLASGLALARSTNAAETGDVEAAQRWFESGLAAVRRGELASARRSFGAAYALVPSVDILWNLASTERRLGENVAALAHFRAYVASPEARPDRVKIAEEEVLPELEGATARLSIRADEGASVLVDGRPIGDGSAVVDVMPGMHAIVVKAAGRETTFAVEAIAGRATDVKATMNVSMSVDVSPTPVVRTNVDAPMKAESGRTTTVAVLAGAGAAMIAGGVAFTLLARTDQQEADRLHLAMRSDDLSCKRSGTLCDDYEDARSAAQRSSALGTGMLVTGGVLGGAAIVTWMLWPAATTHVVPSATKDAASLSVVGRF
ncbi:MAG: hypothetical protein KF819_36895 [Labilithrix sp.]|nr:hypothetical protein [Labilithrix sp.]